MRPAHRLLLAASCLALAAFRFPTSLDNPPPPSPPSFTLEDKRPADNLDSEIESLSISNCAYGIYRAGTEDMTPTPADVVRNMLAARANDALAGRAVELRNFTMHVNSQLQLTNMTMAAIRAQYGGGGGPVAPEHAIIGCAPDDLRGGFVIDEIDEEASPMILVVDVAVDGVAYHGRCIGPSPMFSPPLKSHKPEAHARWNASVAAGLGCVLDKLARQITAGTPVAIPTPPLSRAERAREAAAKRREARQRARDADDK